MGSAQDTIKMQIVAALSHTEAEDGLYFNNLIIVHEEEERPIVAGEDKDIKDALDGMVKEGSVVVDGSGDTAVYRLGRARSAA